VFDDAKLSGTLPDTEIYTQYKDLNMAMSKPEVPTSSVVNQVETPRF